MHIQENQLVPELLLKVSDNLHRYIEHVCEEVSCQKNFFWLNNLAIMYGLCILDISFLH